MEVLGDFMKMSKLKKIAKITGIVLGIIVVLVIAALLFGMKPLAISVYEDNFGKRFTSYEPTTWEIEDFDGLMRDKYTFSSDQGQLLTGYKYYRNQVETKGVMVIAHGFGGGGHRSYMNVADYFARNGYVVFGYDATGNDESEGDAVGGLPQGVIDLDYALRFLKSSEEFQNLPIVLWGHSWGGYSVGSVMKLHPDVKAAVIVSGFNSSLDMLEIEGRNIAGDAIDYLLPYLEEHEKEIFGEYATMNVLESLDATDASVMFIHSDDDDMIPVTYSMDRYYEKYKDDERFTFVRYKDRGHNYLFCAEDRKEYIEKYNSGSEAYLESLGEISQEKKEEMIAAYHEEHLDKHKAYQLDEELMMQILELYNSNIR